MITSLTKVGDSDALVIDKSVMELLGLRETDKVQLQVSGRSLIVTPVDPAISDEEYEAASKKLHDKYGEVFKRLA